MCAASAGSRFTLRANMTLLGAPGSGKGFYGRYLAKAWKVPLYSASRILRASTFIEEDLDSGVLVRCETVAEALLNFFQTHHESGFFLLDGFPRTQRQIDLMDQTWPPELQIAKAFRLNVPDSVCCQKISGRRVCKICQEEPNNANVNINGFCLPPNVPKNCENRCNPTTDWYRRPDDESSKVIGRRLADYRRHEVPLTTYYSSVKGLCSFTPYNGAKDVPRLQSTLESWLS